MAEAREAGVVEPTASTGLERIPEMIGRYRVTGYLGRGGMGMVLSAQDTELKRPVALKLLHHGAWGDKASSRIEREAQAMAKLSHPNVVTVYEVGRSGDQPFIAMELVDGVTLREWLRGEKRSWRKTLAMIVAAGRGLAAAHEAGLVHRDFKPENVLVGVDGRPRVSDFGLVASSTVEAETIRSSDGASVVAGTPAYMAPEQWRGDEVDARADQYAFAVTCWEALWGERPFASRDMLEAARGNIQPEPVRTRSRQKIPRRLETVLRRALQVDRDKRWRELPEFLDRIEHIARDRSLALGVTALGISSVAAVIAFRAGGGLAAESPCGSFHSALGDVWSDGRQRDLSAAFAGRPEPYARHTWADVQQTIDAWVADYRDMRVQACSVRRRISAGAGAIANARDRCLDRRRDELSAFLAALEQPDATTVQYARAAARGLTRPLACLSVQSDAADMSEPPLGARDALDEIRRQLVEVSTVRALGKPRDAVALAEEVATKAETLAWPRMIAESQLELGLSYQAANANAEGERAHARAVLQADASHADEIRFAAMIGLAVAGMNHSRYDDAGRAIESARMVARRLPPDDRREVILDLNESILAFWRGDYDVCISRARQTLAKIATVLGPNAVEGALLGERLSHCLYKADRISESEAAQRDALAIADVATGREHPLAADILFGLGYTALARGAQEEALAQFRESLAIRERVLGPDNPIVGVSLTGIGDLLAGLGRYPEAKDTLLRARAILESSWGADSPALASAERMLGELAMDLSDYEAAEVHFRRALDIYRMKRPKGHDELSYSLANLGRALLAQGDRGALTVLEEAADSYAASPSVRSDNAAMARFHLGRALVKFESRARGIAFIREACPVLEASKEKSKLSLECRAYLANLGIH